jgi:hypothetical protein
MGAHVDEARLMSGQRGRRRCAHGRAAKAEAERWHRQAGAALIRYGLIQ